MSECFIRSGLAPGIKTLDIKEEAIADALQELSADEEDDDIDLLVIRAQSANES